MAGNLPVVPSRASLSASGRAAAPSTMRNGGAQHFYGSARGTMTRPASFQQQTASLRQSMQQSHVGAIPAGGRSNASFAGRGNSNMRPSAGIPANRQMNNFGNRAGNNQSMQNGNRGSFNNNRPGSGMNSAQRGTSQAAPAENRGGFRPFTPPSNSSRSPGSNMNSYRPEPQRGTSQAAPAENRGGFRQFSPPSRNEMSSSGSNGYSPNRGNGNNYWNRTAPSTSGQRGYSSPYSGSYGRGSSSRPQLDMRQPIVRGPSYGGAPRGSYGGGYGGYRGAPSYGGSHSAPSYGGSRGPSYGGGGGGHAPSGGGGHSYGGGGGGHSSGGGGGHSSGGGGGHSSGGGGHSGGGHH